MPCRSHSASVAVSKRLRSAAGPAARNGRCEARGSRTSPYRRGGGAWLEARHGLRQARGCLRAFSRTAKDEAHAGLSSSSSAPASAARARTWCLACERARRGRLPLGDARRQRRGLLPHGRPCRLARGQSRGRMERGSSSAPGSSAASPPSRPSRSTWRSCGCVRLAAVTGYVAGLQRGPSEGSSSGSSSSGASHETLRRPARRRARGAGRPENRAPGLGKGGGRCYRDSGGGRRQRHCPRPRRSRRGGRSRRKRKQCSRSACRPSSSIRRGRHADRPLPRRALFRSSPSPISSASSRRGAALARQARQAEGRLEVQVSGSSRRRPPRARRRQRRVRRRSRSMRTRTPRSQQVGGEPCRAGRAPSAMSTGFSRRCATRQARSPASSTGSTRTPRGSSPPGRGEDALCAVTLGKTFRSRAARKMGRGGGRAGACARAVHLHHPPPRKEIGGDDLPHARRRACTRVRAMRSPRSSRRPPRSSPGPSSSR